MLPNGLRYAIQKNGTPRGQVAMRLVILAESMHEADDQRGLAHFLEHMAFHGSRNVADREMERTLQRLGLKPGADTNAGTGPQSTVYFLNLARNDGASIDTGLMLLREIASNLVLDPALVDAERNVLLAEERARAGPGQRLGEALLAVQVGDHPVGRSPIGTSEVIRTATPARIRDFYDAYYRPERAVLLVVGEVSPSEIEGKIKAGFQDWSGRGPAGGEPPPLSAPPQGDLVRVIVEPGVAENGLTLDWPRPYAPRRTDRAESVRREKETIANIVFNQRLMAQSNEAGRPFALSGVGRNDIEGVTRGATIRAGSLADPSQALSLLLRAHSQLARFGLTQIEVDRAVAARRASLQRLAVPGTTRSNGELIGDLQGSAATGYVYLSPAERLEIFEEAVAGLTADQASRELRGLFDGAPARITYFGEKPPVDGVAGLSRVLDAGSTPQQAYAAPAIKPWRHTDFGRPGKVADRREVKDLGVTLVRFANGVRLTVKSTDFAKGQVELSVRFGNGQLDLPRDRLAASDWATSLLSSGGLEDLSALEVGRSLQGKNVMAFVATSEDTFVITSFPSGTPFSVPSTALDLELQLMTAMVTRPGWRPDNWANMVASSPRFEASADATPAAVFSSQARTLLHSNDMRWVRSTSAMHATWKPEEATAFMKPILDSSPLEVIVVGDITPEQAIESTAKTFGALPRRVDQPEPAGLQDVRFPAPTPTPVVLRHKGRGDQALAHVSWPTTDFLSDTRQALAASVLADAITMRLTERLRFEDHKAYSVGARADFSFSLPGYGRIGASAGVEPADAEAALQAIDAIAADLAASPLTADEFKRLIEPKIETSRREARSNGVWMADLGKAQTDPRRLKYIRDRQTLIESLTAGDVQAAAKRWLVKDRSWRLTILPEAKSATAAAETKPPAPAGGAGG